MWPPDEELEPNVFYEPRTATAPFYVMQDGHQFADEGPLDSRGEAEELARRLADTHGTCYFVLGAVSISSCPPPVKASTRALV